MNPVNTHKLLETMQQMAKQASGQQSAQEGDFKQALMNAVGKTNELQKASSDLQARYERGEPGVELIDVMVASQKSSVSFQALTQVRNRLVNAYQDIMNMQI